MNICPRARSIPDDTMSQSDPLFDTLKNNVSGLSVWYVSVFNHFCGSGHGDPGGDCVP